MIGEIEGVVEGQFFESRQALHDANVHRGTMRGIDGKNGSIVLSGGYVDDEDLGDEIIYTGHGGQENKRQVADQTLTGGNLELENHFRQGNPIRVTRGKGLRSDYAPKEGYRYGGLYRIESVWSEKGREGFLIWRYRLIKLTKSELIPPPPPKGSSQSKRGQVTISRVIRNSEVGNYVKELYDYTCQISGERLDTPTGPYAEACHIKPVGKPHNGPDDVTNVVCLSPNMHVLFDLGAISINEDLTLLGRSGRITIKETHHLADEVLSYHKEHIY